MLPIIGWVSAAIQIAKLLWEVWKLIRELKKSDDSFKVKEVVSRMNEAIEEYKRTGSAEKIISIKEELEKRHKDSAISAPWNTKGLG